jgi:hypothetical protein
MSGRRFKCPGPSPTLGSLGESLGPLTNGATSPGCHSGVPLAFMVLGALLMKRCMTGILVVGDVLEHCLVVGCVLGVVRLEVRLIAGLLPWSSGK